MKPLTDLEREQLIHMYDPVKAHEYYMRTRKLKGRKPGSGQPKPTPKASPVNSRAKQRQALSAAIKLMESKLQDLEALIKKKEHEEASSNRKSKAKRERAAKEHTKPKTAAEKAKQARENKKYRDKHKQKLKSDAKSKSGGGSSRGKSSATDSSNKSLSELKSLATRVRGQIQVAKQKLAAL